MGPDGRGTGKELEEAGRENSNQNIPYEKFLPPIKEKNNRTIIE